MTPVSQELQDRILLSQTGGTMFLLVRTKEDQAITRLIMFQVEVVSKSIQEIREYKRLAVYYQALG